MPGPLFCRRTASAAEGAMRQRPTGPAAFASVLARQQSECVRPVDQCSSRPSQNMNALNSLGWARKYPTVTIGAVMRSQSCIVHLCKVISWIHYALDARGAPSPTRQKTNDW